MVKQLKLQFILLMSALTLQTQASVELNFNSKMEFASKQINARNTMEHYSLGSDIKDASILYFDQKSLDYDSIQNSVSVDIHYPEETANATPATAALITKLELYLEGSDGFESQAYMLNGGIGERNVTVQITAGRTNLLHYSFIVYGVRV